MPLHLLGKKSWNVYNQVNVDRVRQDEAKELARQEAEEQRMQEEDHARRLALLRGDPVPRLRSRSPEPSHQESSRPHRSAADEKDASRPYKRKRLPGEDDTDRDIRYAKEDAERGVKARDILRSKIAGDPDDFSLVDQAGHILLVQPPRPSSKPASDHQKGPPADDTNQGMRFSDAAGFRNHSKDTPWYAETSTTTSASSPTTSLPPRHPPSALALVAAKDVWGNEDPRRKEREQTRIVSNDPLAVMQRAQKQLKQSEVDREVWKKQRDREADRIRDQARRHAHRKPSRRRSRSRDSLEGFSLDASDASCEYEHTSRSHGRRHTRHDRDADHRARKRGR